MSRGYESMTKMELLATRTRLMSERDEVAAALAMVNAWKSRRV